MEDKLYHSDDPYSAYQNQAIGYLNNKQSEQEKFLRRFIPDHDCHNGPEDGCDCTELDEMWNKMSQREKNEKMDLGTNYN